MNIIAFNRYWIIRWSWVVINLLVVSMLIGLSLWQWQRAVQKTQLVMQLSRGQQLGELSSAQLLAVDVNQRDGVHIAIYGRWLSPMVWLIDNQMVSGRVGYDVLIAVEDTTGGDTVVNVAAVNTPVFLVNLGWVAAPLSRDALPVIDVPAMVAVNGVFRTTSSGLLLGKNIEDKHTWPMRIQQIDQTVLSSYVKSPMISGVIYQQANTPFVVHYRPVVVSPARHKAYALQWLLLAVAVVVVAVLASAHKYEKGVTA